MAIFNKEVAKEAIMTTRIMIKMLMDQGITSRKDLHIIVGTSDGEVLVTESIGNPEKWHHQPQLDLAFANPPEGTSTAAASKHST